MSTFDRRTSHARIPAFIALAGGFLLWIACGGGVDDGSMDEDTSAADVKNETLEALETGQDYLTEEQRELARRAQIALEGAKEEMMDAKRELAMLPEEARDELEQAIERADEASAELGRELSDMQSDMQKAGADGMAEIEGRLEAALEEVAEARREIIDALGGEQSSQQAASG